MAAPSHTVYHFSGKLERFTDGFKYFYVAVPLSAEISLPAGGRLRMTGTMNGIPVDRGLIPDGKGGHYIILGGELRRQARLKPGDTVTFSLTAHPSPDEPAVPEELQAALDMEPDAQQLFDKIPPGLKRSVMTYITTAKRPETRAKRATFLLDRILSGYYLRGRHNS